MKQELKQELYYKVLETLDLNEELANEELYRKIDQVMEMYSRMSVLPLSDRMRYREAIYASLRKLDILSLAMDDADITEIMVNGKEHIFVERNGTLESFDDTFMTDEKLNDVVQQIASQVNRRVNEASPMVDARLSDGSRVNIVLPPIAVDGPAVLW